jgi:hypothetical protein
MLNTKGGWDYGMSTEGFFHDWSDLKQVFPIWVAGFRSSRSLAKYEGSK